MNWLITNFMAAFLLPPLNLLVLLALGASLLHSRFATYGRRLIWLAIALLCLLATPLVGHTLLATLQEPYNAPAYANAQAIVVLGGGVYHDAPEYGGDTVRSYSLERLRYAARLQHASGLPLLASGGRPEGGEAESLAMWSTLRKDFGVDTRWVEITSLNTGESARNSYAILQPSGITRILLVTHAWHMARARAAFEKAGFTVIAAPTIYVTERKLTVLDFLPSAKGLMQSHIALHEWIGMLWYKLKGSG
jgi:uncharacterized SAM-binding protein YcdF (DUF218 family)